jgi:hypothetical protein
MAVGRHIRTARSCHAYDIAIQGAGLGFPTGGEQVCEGAYRKDFPLRCSLIVAHFRLTVNTCAPV